MTRAKRRSLTGLPVHAMALEVLSVHRRKRRWLISDEGARYEGLPGCEGCDGLWACDAAKLATAVLSKRKVGR